MSIKILDLSAYDGREIKSDGSMLYHPINWELAKSKWAGAIVKGSNGIVADPLYAAQIDSIRAAGALWGSYHFFDSTISPTAAAGKFCDFIEVNHGYGSLGVWLDAETNPMGLDGISYITKLNLWLIAVKSRMGMAGKSALPLGIYTRASFIDPLWIDAGSPAYLQQYPAWLAQYSYDKAADFEIKYSQVMSGALVPPLPVSKALPHLYNHQWTARGKPMDVPGYPPYKKAVDFNYWQKSITQSTEPSYWPAGTSFEEILEDHEKRLRALESGS